MTQAQTLKAIKALGLTAFVGDGEFRVAYGLPAYQALGYGYKDAVERNEAQAYYTDDREDALATAKTMAANKGEWCK